MSISFKKQNGMAVGEGCPAKPPHRSCPCVARGYESCQRRETGQLFCLQKSLKHPVGLVQFKVPLKQSEIAGCTAIQPGDNWPLGIVSGQGIKLDKDWVQRLFAVKGFVRMAWLQGDDALLQSRRFLGTVKQKKGDSLWHLPLHLPADQSYIRQNVNEIDSWGSQVWFDLEPREPRPREQQNLVVNVRDRDLGSNRTLADDARKVLEQHCRSFVEPQQLEETPITFDQAPAPSNQVIPFVEIRVPFHLGPFVIGMNYDGRGEAGIQADRDAFPLNRIDTRGNPKCAIPALRAPDQAALPISSFRGPFREAIRWTGWLNHLRQNSDPADELCGWTEGSQAIPQRASRMALSFQDDLSSVVLPQESFGLREFYFTNDLLNPKVKPNRDPSRPPRKFNPMQILYCKELQNQIILRIHRCTVEDLWLVKNALRLIHLGFFRIGRFRSRGFGRVHLGDAMVDTVTDLQSWLRDPREGDNYNRETWPCTRQPAATPTAESPSPQVRPKAPPRPQAPPFNWDCLEDSAFRERLRAEECKLDDTHVLYCVQNIDNNKTSGFAIVKKEDAIYKQDGWEWQKPGDAQVQNQDWFLGTVNGQVSKGNRQLTKKGCTKILP